MKLEIAKELLKGMDELDKVLTVRAIYPLSSLVQLAVERGYDNDDSVSEFLMRAIIYRLIQLGLAKAIDDGQGLDKCAIEIV